MSTIESPNNLNRLHALWTSDRSQHEFEFFTELKRVVKIAVVVTTGKPPDVPENQDAISGVLLHFLTTSRRKTRSRLEDIEPQESFFNYVWEVTKNYLDDCRNKKTLHLVRANTRPRFDDEGELLDETKLEEDHHQYVRENPPAPRLSADCIEDAVARNIAEEMLTGTTMKAASEAAGVTADAGRKKLSRLGNRLTPKMLEDAYELSAEAKAIEEWRPTLKIAGVIDRNDPRLETGYRGLQFAA